MKYFYQIEFILNKSINLFIISILIGTLISFTYKTHAETINLDSPREISELFNEEIPFNIPQGVDVDYDGNVYVVDYAYSFIFKYDGSTWSSIGNEEFTTPRNVVIDEDNNIYVVADNGHIYKYSSQGVYQEDIFTEGYLTDVAFDSDNNMYVVISGSYIALKTGDNNFETYADSINTMFTDISSITFDNDDNLYVVDEGARQIMKYNSTEGWDTLPNPSFGMDEPNGIRVDSNDTVFFIDHDEDWLAMYDPVLSTWDNYDANSSFSNPVGLAIFENATDLIIYVADGLGTTVFKLVYDNPYASPEQDQISTSIVKNVINKDNRCKWTEPEETTWILSKPLIQNNISGIQLTWTQYSSDKIDILIDDGTGNYPWKLNKIINDGNEFIPNVQVWQKVKIKPYNHCKEGIESTGVSNVLYPSGWYNLK